MCQLIDLEWLQKAITCVNYITAVREIQCTDQLECEFMHQWIRNSLVCKPDTKTRQRLPHKLKDQADVCSIWTLVFEIINEVADIGVACFILFPISKMSQDFSLINVCSLTITLSAEDFEGSELLFICPEIVLTARSMNCGHQWQY